MTRWDYGHTYVAGVRDLDGLFGDPEPPAALADPDEEVSGILDSLVEATGGDRDGYQSVTRFTVGSNESVTAPIRAMTATARAEDHPVRRLRSNPPLLFSKGAADDHR
ncbi:MAG: hypothetical protein M5U19_14590 [Microthrixaceae bacterium]|nr:hypothetical protein [Microthrixaceae bacterium]